MNKNRKKQLSNYKSLFYLLLSRVDIQALVPPRRKIPKEKIGKFYKTIYH